MFSAIVTNHRIPPGSQGTGRKPVEMAKVGPKPSDTHLITAVRILTAWSPR